ncbi:CoA-binding protein [Haloarchaeobius salinus]|uniref:CoA-binding protein n=1 Tax=Haloarchaeobius salinus TaxID=1198298 RepID=UPI00210B564F|nr:CoA-binding protein [Haloarchaeobius salinus]
MPVKTDTELEQLFDLDTIAVVGCSTTPGKAAHDVPKYMQAQGYDVVPVNPFADEILGERAYDSLDEVDHDVDIVDVFRPSEEIPGIVDDVLERDDVQALWLQLGIADDEAAARAEDAGLLVVQNKCIKVEHSRLRG